MNCLRKSHNKPKEQIVLTQNKMEQPFWSFHSIYLLFILLSSLNKTTLDTNSNQINWTSQSDLVNCHIKREKISKLLLVWPIIMLYMIIHVKTPEYPFFSSNKRTILLFALLFSGKRVQKGESYREVLFGAVLTSIPNYNS